MDHSPAVAWIKDHEFRYRYINRAYEDLFQLRTDEVIGKEDYDFLPLEVADLTRSNDQQVINTGLATEVVEQVPGADGVLRHWLVKKFPFEGDGGKLWTGGMAFEITKRVEAQQQLRESQTLYASLVKSIPMHVFRKDLEGRITYMSPGYLGKLDESAESILGKTDFDLFPKELAEKYRQDDNTVVSKEKTLELVEEFEDQSGERSYVQTLKTPVRDPDGKITGIQGIFWDITEKKVAQEKLAQRESELRQIIDAVPHRIFMKDHSGRYLLANRAVAEAYNLSPEEMLGCHQAELHPDPEEARSMLKADQQVIESGRERKIEEQEFATTDGKQLYLNTTKIPFELPGKKRAVLGISIDVTRERVATEALKQALQRQELHVKRTPLAVIEWNLEFRVMDWNPAAERIFGYPRDVALGQHASFIVPEEARHHVDDVWNQLLSSKGGLQSSNANLHRSGRKIQCEWHNTPLVTGDGNVIGVASLVADVTELKEAEAEKERIQKKLLETQKLESLGVLAGGIAHDFNNLLTSILGNASIARMKLPEESPLTELMNKIEQSTNRAADLCAQMLAYSGKGQFVIRDIDLNHLIRETTRLLKLSINKKAELRFELQGGLPNIMADETQIRQIVMNLVINASEAIGDMPGTISLKSGTIWLEEPFEPITPDSGFTPGQFVCLEVRDSGCGMDEETRQKIFDPFFTTKFTGRGLGLAAVQGIMRGHGGTIQVHSKQGEGTTFKILIPRSKGAMHGKKEPGRTDESETAIDGMVLVVDDEEPVRTVTRDILEVMGLRAVTAKYGIDGLEQFKKLHQTLDLVILDLTMPKLNGEETFHKLREINKGIPIVLMSGFNEQETIKRFAGMGLAGFIEKPFSADQFMAKVRAAVSSGI